MISKSLNFIKTIYVNQKDKGHINYEMKFIEKYAESTHIES